jgi:hypothetical protein
VYLLHSHACGLKPTEAPKLILLLLPRPRYLVSIHCHPLASSAQFAICAWRNRSAPLTNARLLEGEQLLRTEGLVVDLRSGFDEVLQMGAGEEVAEVDEFAVCLILDCDNASVYV